MDVSKQFQIQLINEGEMEIKDNIIKFNNQWHKYYGLLNKESFRNYQNFLYNNSNDTIQFYLKYDNMKPNFENQDYNLSIPTNFVLVKEDVFNYNLDYFDKNAPNQQQRFIYEVFIGGECLIIKDKNYNNVYYVSLYNINNTFQYNNVINYILIYKDVNGFNGELNKIMQKGFLSYINEYNINQKQNNNDIYDSKGILIGRIINNSLKYCETINILKNNNVINEENQILHLIMLCLFQTTLLVNELNKDSNKRRSKMVQLFVEYFLKIKEQKDCSKVNIKLNSQLNPNMTKNYKDIIYEMLSKLDKELTIFTNKDTYKQGQINQYSETNLNNQIFKEHENGSIVKKYFCITFEIKTICNNCSIPNLNHESIKFLYINLDNENKNVLISDKLINYIKPMNIQCNFCGQKVNSQNEIKIFIYPRILIVILEGNNYKNFSIKKQKEININNRLYKLYCLCEKNPNNFYFKNSNGWYYNIENNKCMKIPGIETTKPAILFYQFSGYIKNDRNNINQNINNYDNNKISLSDRNINKHMNLNMNQMNNNIINNINQNNAKIMKYNNNMNQMNYFNNYNIFGNNIMNNQNNHNFNNNNMINKMNNINYNMNNNFIQNNMNINMNNNNIVFNNMNINNNLINNNMNIKMNNFLCNNMNMINNLNINNMNFNMNNFNNKNNNIPLLKSKNIFLTFILNGKQIFIESNENEIFKDIISKLEKKYNWVKSINKKAYFYNNKEITMQNLTLKQLNIPDNSIIYIAS